MRNRSASGVGLISVALLLLLAVGGALPALGGSAERPVLPPKPSAGSLAAMDSRLAAVVSAYRRGGDRAGVAEARRQRVRLSAQGAHVVVGSRGTPAAATAAVQSAHGLVTRQRGSLLEARVPVSRLEVLARDPRVAELRATALFVTDVVSEGVAVTRASLWHTAALTGAGTKVAILDPGFQGYQPLLGTELPASVETHNLCSPGAVTGATEHGTAVAEIVHDVAPGAQLRLVCFDSELDLQPAVTAAVSAGVDVIVHSVSWFNVSRGDGNGPPNTPDYAALSARSQGVLWVNSVGNQREQHWSGAWVDYDGDDLLDWSAYQWANQVTIHSGESVCATLRWDAWPTTNQDFDLYLLDMSDYTLVAWSENFQTGTQPPTEELCWQNSGPTGYFGFLVSRYSATTAPRFDFFFLGSESPIYKVEAGSLTEPGSSPATLAVGAACHVNGAVQPYSSIGPTIDGRPKPELVAPDAVSTQTYGASSSCSSGFTGTSASAPHVGGLAALVEQRTPSISPGGIVAYLETLARGDDPASRKVAFHPVVDGGPIAYFQASGLDAYGFANSDGTTLPPSISSVAKSTPHFSPDGTKIAFSAQIDTPAAELHVSNPDGTGLVRLTTGGAAGPDWSPDGSKIYFVRSGDIWRVNSDGTGLVQVTTSGETPIGPLDVSPDGSKITYAAQYAPSPGYISWGLFVVDSSGTGATKIANGDGTGMSPHFSPDGSKIAFHRILFGTGVYTINPDGTGESAALVSGRDPVWTPDGDIVFASIVGAYQTHLSRMEADGTGVVQLTSRASSYAAPEIGPANGRPIAVDSPTLAGEFLAGRFVVASPVTWVGGSPFAVSRQWHRCDSSGGSCSPISGATDTFYGVTGADTSGTLRYTETASNGGGSTSAYFGLPATVAPPLVIGAPWLNISLGGVTLTASTGLWQGSPTQFTYRWQRSPIGERETWIDAQVGPSPSRTLGAADLGSRIRVIVTASNSVGAATAVSAPTIVVGGQPVPTLDARIDLSAQPYRLVPGQWRAFPAATISWQWFRWPSGSSPTAIPGATGPTYQPTAADVGAVLYAQEYASNSFGSGFVSTAVTPTIGLLSTAPPTVSGTPQVGQTLNSDTGSWSPSVGLTFGYRWQRSTEGERWRDVAGANASAYIVAAADAGARLRVVVTASGGGQSASAVSAPTAPVAP